jgi:hypothetical protein
MSILSSTNSGIYSKISAPLLRSRGYEEVEKGDGVNTVWKSKLSLIYQIKQRDDSFWCDSLAEGKSIIIKTYSDLIVLEEYVNCLKTGHSTKGYRKLKEALGV